MRLALRDLLNKPRQLAASFARAPGIGLYIGREKVHMVQMEESPEYPRIRALLSTPMPLPREELVHNRKAFRALLKQAHATQPFAGNRVVSSLSAAEVKISMVSYRRQKGQTDEESLVAELRERMQAELDETVVDFVSLRHSDPDVEHGEALVAMASRKSVMRYLQALTAAGLEVEALDVGPNALARLVRHSGARNWSEYPKLPSALLINVGVLSSFLTVIWGRRLILDRPIEFSEARLLARLVKVLGVSESLALHMLHNLDQPSMALEDARNAVLEVLRPEIQALQQEINKTLVYMASKTRGKSVDVLHLAGCASRYPGLLGGLEQSLQVPVVAVNPITMFETRPGQPALDKALGERSGVVLATGLALRDLPERGTWT